MLAQLLNRDSHLMAVPFSQMRTSAPPLLAIFRSQLQGELLALVLLGETPNTIADLARQLDAPLSTVHREVRRLERAGILHTEQMGRNRLVSPNHANPAVQPLRELVAITFGPRHVVEEEFSGLAQVSGLYIFGSWAARNFGVEGHTPGDVDILVVGSPDRDEVFAAADRAQIRLHREINTTIVSDQRWTDSEEPFLRTIRSQPLLELQPLWNHS